MFKPGQLVRICSSSYWYLTKEIVNYSSWRSNSLTPIPQNIGENQIGFLLRYVGHRSGLQVRKDNWEVLVENKIYDISELSMTIIGKNDI